MRSKPKWQPSLLIGLVVLLILSSAVACTQLAPPTIALDPSGFSFNAQQGKKEALKATLNISNSGDSAMDWSLSTNAKWLNLYPTNGRIKPREVDQVKLTVDASGMRTGSYSSTITISAPGASNTPQTVPVSLTVTAYSEEHEVSFHLRPDVPCPPGRTIDWRCDYRQISFTLKEHQKIQLWWFAYGKRPYVYVTLERPDGTYYAGHKITPGGYVKSFTPTDSLLLRGDGGSSGELNFYCSSIYDEHCGKTLYPPGSYVLCFAVYKGYPYFFGLTDGSEVEIKVKYRIEFFPT